MRTELSGLNILVMAGPECIIKISNRGGGDGGSTGNRWSVKCLPKSCCKDTLGVWFLVGNPLLNYLINILLLYVNNMLLFICLC